MSYRRVGLTLLMAAALGAGVFPPKAVADSNARIVRLSYVDSDVQIDRRDGRGFEHAFLNMPLVPGTRVTTRDDGRAEIEFEDGSTVRLTPNTLVETQSLDLRSSGAKNTLVDLQEGTAYFNIRKLEGDDDFRVTVGRREFRLTRASHFRLLVDRSQVVLAVFKGEVEVIGEGSQLTVRKQETLTLDLDDPARYYLAKGVSGDRYDDWDHERDQYRERYASVGNYRGYSSAYSYGVSDLNYWGRYTYISGYGYMWRPYFYGADWSPFQDGAWYWYPGAGWIWVSAYPWGWMPYRYGNWYYIGGHGWCWRPAQRWNSWSPVVVVHNAPAGQRLPVAPPPTARRDPVVVGRGPTTILPPRDPGPEQLIRNRDLLGRRGGTAVVGGSSSGAAETPASGPRVRSSGVPGNSVVSGSGPGAPAGSGATGRPAAELEKRPAPPDREVDIEDAIRNAREHRATGGQSGGVITNSGSGNANTGPGSAGNQGGSVSSSGGSSSGVASPPVPSPASGRERVPEPRRMLPPSITRDSPTPGAASGSAAGGSAGIGSSGGSSNVSGSGAASAPAVPAPSPGVVRTPQPRREVPREYFVQSSGSSSSGSGAGSVGRSNSGGSAGGSSGGSAHSSPPPSSGGSSGGSAHSSPPPSSGGSSWHGSGGSSGSSSGGQSTAAGSAGAGPSSSSGRNSSPTPRPSRPR